MSLILVAILMIGGLVGAAAVVVAVPALLGLMAYDVSESRKNEVVTEKDARTRIALERGVARAFVILGGLFWSVAVFAGLFSFGSTGVGYALLAAFFPMVAVLATLAIGWYYERAAAVLLVAASFAVVAWGVIYQFELGVWMLMAFFLIGPMLTAAVLFWLARRDQEALELALRLTPELAPVTAEQ